MNKYEIETVEKWEVRVRYRIEASSLVEAIALIEGHDEIYEEWESTGDDLLVGLKYIGANMSKEDLDKEIRKLPTKLRRGFLGGGKGK